MIIHYDTGQVGDMAESQNPFDSTPAPAPDSLGAPAAAQPAAALDAAVFAAPVADPEAPGSTGTGPTIPTPGNFSRSTIWAAYTSLVPSATKYARAEGDDARVAWRVANAKALEDKEDEEKKENDAVKVKAQASHRSRFNRPWTSF